VASSDKFKKFDDLFNAADKAVYESKNSGRNKVTAHSKTFE
jgi:PleD family two-component response regulator